MGAVRIQTGPWPANSAITDAETGEPILGVRECTIRIAADDAVTAELTCYATADVVVDGAHVTRTVLCPMCQETIEQAK